MPGSEKEKVDGWRVMSWACRVLWLTAYVDMLYQVELRSIAEQPRCVRRMTDTALARSSDDFWPRDPASHTTHVAINAGNSVFMAALVQPDWDMFQSQHPAAVLHASARVVCCSPTAQLCLLHSSACFI